MDVMKQILAPLLAPVVLLAGCSKSVEKDCAAAIPAVNVASLRAPRTEKERTQDVEFLTATLTEWKTVSVGLKTPEVREKGSAVAAQLSARKALLESARVEAKAAPPPASSADPRKTALAEAAAAGMAGLLGGAGTLPPETVRQLETNGETVEKLRLDLIDWCQENE